MRSTMADRARVCGAVAKYRVQFVIGSGPVWGQGNEPAPNPPESPAQNSGQAPGKGNPDAPGEGKKREESGNPAQQAVDMTRQAAERTERAAAAGLIRARNWESTWIEGVYVRRDQPLITLTTREREVIYLRQTLTTPGAYLKRAFGAGIDQASGTPRQWDDGW